jgi:hypothetical protein
MHDPSLSQSLPRGQREWIVIKGIADWGKEKNDKHQNDASKNAIAFALKLIELLPSGNP